MERSLELYIDGHVIEIENGQPIKAIDTKGSVKALVEFLKFSPAKTFTLAPPDKTPSDVEFVQPRGAQHVNSAGVKLIAAFEGCKLNAYQDAVNIWTIGYGHTKDVHPGMSVTQAQAEQLLQTDLEEFESAVESVVSVELDSNQFSALVAFCFNVGPQALFESTLLRVLNQGNTAAAANEFPRWDKAGEQHLLGLTRRRLAERSLFLSQSWEPFREYDKLQLTHPPMKGDFIRHIQETLVRSGMSLQASGVFDEPTEQAVKQFQQQKQLGVDGVVGLETTKLLCV
jgi:lysozyme